MSSRGKRVVPRHVTVLLGVWTTLAVAACDTGPTTAADQPAIIETVSGDEQIGKAGVELESPFVARVTDQDGDPVAGVGVEWRIRSGAGRFRPNQFGDGADRAVRVTLADGRALAFFIPMAYGPSEVTASVIDHPEIPAVSFGSDVNALVIRIEDNWGYTHCGAICFWTPADVPVGGTVEWSNMSSVGDVHLRSTTTPPGGTAIDGLVPSLGTWRTQLDTEGVWAYEAVNLPPGAASTGTITVR